MQDPTIGRIVIYRSKVGGYDLPAIITATQETLNPEGVALYSETHGSDGVPPLSSPDHVHLTVFSPGLSSREPPKPLDANHGGTYREWNVALAPPGYVTDKPAPGTWRWPERR